MNPIVYVGHKENTLSFTYMITDYCNYKCNYCSVAPHSNKSPDEKNIENKKWKFVITILKKLDTEFKITILGGEPGLHSDFFNIVKSLNSIEKCVSIEIITNFSKPNKFFEKLNDFKSNKISMVISYHPEYDNNMFLKKLNSFNPTFDVEVSVSLYKGYLDECKNILDNSKFKSYPIYLTDTNTFTNNLEITPDIKKFFKYNNHQIPYTYADGVVRNYTPIDIYKNNLNRFKGYQCKRTIYDINANGEFKDSCDQTNIGLLPKKEDLLKYKPCKTSQCADVTFLNFEKKI